MERKFPLARQGAAIHRCTPQAWCRRISIARVSLQRIGDPSARFDVDYIVVSLQFNRRTFGKKNPGPRLLASPDS
jgi:hypothetical protein